MSPGRVRARQPIEPYFKRVGSMHTQPTANYFDPAILGGLLDDGRNCFGPTLTGVCLHHEHALGGCKCTGDFSSLS
jgi:hypothetical protein